jgi:hypothetical protein
MEKPMDTVLGYCSGKLHDRTDVNLRSPEAANHDRTRTGGGSRMSKKPQQLYLVAYQTDEWTWLMGWDGDCDGAICVADPPVVFTSRSDAKKAIAVSRAFALLQKAQGKVYNSDFTTEIRNVKIIPAVFSGESK